MWSYGFNLRYCTKYVGIQRNTSTHGLRSISSQGYQQYSSLNMMKTRNFTTKISSRSNSSSSSSFISSKSLFSSSSSSFVASLSYLTSSSVAHCSPNLYPINPAYLPPIRPQYVSYIPPPPHQETTFQYIKRQIHNLWRYLKRFFYASKRITECSLVIGSAVLLTPPALYFGKEDFLWQYIVDSIQYLGPTFIKLAQWASSRPDLFPEELTAHLERLQDSVMTYPWSIASHTLDKAFGENWRDRLTLDETPIGSGCIAQVYKGVLTLPNGKKQDVAVKLIHPHVKKLISVDMDIMRFFARFIELIPSIEYLSMGDIVEEFAKNMARQNDLRLEAKHLMKFRRNFADHDNIIFPEPIPGYVHENALVETYHEGKSITTFMRKDVDKKTKDYLVNLCSTSLIEMVFKHNFVHGDLHPGNILVQKHPTKGYSLIFLDCGIVTKVKKHQFRSLLDICLALLHYDGRKAAMLLADQSVQVSPEQFENYCSGVEKIVTRASQLNYFEHLGDYVTEVCHLSCVNHVKVIPEFFQTAMSIKVAEGIALALDPTIEMARVAIPIIVKTQAQYVMNKALGKRTIDDEDEGEDERMLQALIHPPASVGNVSH